MSTLNYKLMSIDELTNLLKEKHSQLKAHPFWSSPDLDVFKKEIEPMFRKILDIIYGFKHRYVDFDDNHPFICMYSDSYHAINSRIGNCKNYMQKGRQEEFTNFFVPMLQDYLNLIQSFLDGKTDPESYKLRVAKWSNKKGGYAGFTLYMPVFKTSWVNSDGFNFYPSYILSKRGVWFMKQCITGKEVDEVIEDLNRQIKSYEKYLSKHKSDSIQKYLNKCYACLKDIEDKTDFWYHVY